MTSTEFTIGLDGTRVSSKVLRPPGGGSSDIFGLGSTPYSSSNGAGDKRSRNQESSTTQNRLFGAQTNSVSSPVRTKVSNVFESEAQVVTKSVKKSYVRRNPITGEEIIVYAENEQSENNHKEESNGIVQENGDQEKKAEGPSKPIQTSIRVRNPPGGKSSGIF